MQQVCIAINKDTSNLSEKAIKGLLRLKDKAIVVLPGEKETNPHLKAFLTLNEIKHIHRRPQWQIYQRTAREMMIKDIVSSSKFMMVVDRTPEISPTAYTWVDLYVKFATVQKKPTINLTDKTDKEFERWKKELELEMPSFPEK